MTTKTDSPSVPDDVPGTSRSAYFPAYRSVGAWVRFLVPAVLGISADLALKAWSFPHGVPAWSPDGVIPAGRYPAETTDPLILIPHVLGLTTTINRGAVFGIGQGKVYFFLAFSVVALAIILWVFASSRRKQWMVHIALGMITAGALGNLYDRACFAGVRDMLRFFVSWYPYIYNVADIMLCIGVPLLMLTWFLMKEEAQLSIPTTPPAPPAPTA